MPQHLYACLLVLYDAQIASVCQILDVLPQASEDTTVVVVVALFHVGFGFGILVIRKSFLGEFVKESLRASGPNPLFDS